MNKRDILRRIPKVDEVLQKEPLFVFFEDKGQSVVTEAAREAIDALRAEIMKAGDDELDSFDVRRLSADAVALEAVRVLEENDANNLIAAINATGTILHTNLGRAPLCKEAVENVARVSKGYSNLEYDVKAGKRGSRHDIVSEILAELTGAEDAMMVNNNASATMLVLSTMGAGKECVVSRGELVEIGGAFRIPDIMEQSGATLKEVGTTNKTKISDYEKAYDEERTGAFMKVHKSNYDVVGFTEEATLEELVELGREKNVPVIYDMGNGLMVDMSAYGLSEPNVPASLATGIDVILFSGDKLLGGPQAGIIAGKAEWIKKMKKHPLARAIRVDKMTFAAMEETLKKYRDEKVALRDIPVLSMISASPEEMKAKAERLLKVIEEKTEGYSLEVAAVEDQIGGGSAPMVRLPGYAVSVTSDSCTTKAIERLLRKSSIPVIARINDDRLLLCVRTIMEDEFDAVAEALTAK
ncbi:MAG: L-seryl-tRNA(Sec) selenium transferase [Firmicutes bacterium]|nr:L-seryl-tRNA(Sec) selenium transferase [Bacillota bacterium]